MQIPKVNKMYDGNFIVRIVYTLQTLLLTCVGKFGMLCFMYRTVQSCVFQLLLNEYE